MKHSLVVCSVFRFPKLVDVNVTKEFRLKSTIGQFDPDGSISDLYHGDYQLELRQEHRKI
jgi:hypothetical protein